MFNSIVSSLDKEKQILVTAAVAFDLREDILAADFANSLRAGTTALKAAMGAVKAGSAKRIMVIAADTRIAMPGPERVGFRWTTFRL